MTRVVSIAAILLLAACTNDAPAPSNNDRAPARPNILLIVVDDMGFNDLGSFGSEIATPNIDALAKAGIRLTNFQVASTCSPTRSMLLTGVDHHKAGLGNMLEELSPNQKGQPGYEGFLNDRVVTLATMLRDNGYRTMMTGKWHLGAGDEYGPLARGFEQSFSLVSGGASHFADMKPAYAPSPEIKANYRQNGAALTALPDEFEYSTQFYVDHMIEQLDQPAQSDKPFFAYLAFTAPHWPLQAPDAAIARHQGRYDEGYDELMRERLARAKKLGVLPDNAELGTPPPKHLPWNKLSGQEQKVQARAMEIYAAMIDEVDRHSGRLFDYLRQNGKFENTIVVFLADNGAEGHDLDETWPADLFPNIRKTIEDSHDFGYEAMGRPGSYTLYGASWAWSGSPAFDLYKAFPTEGGTRAAAFVHYPERFMTKSIVHDLMSVKDVTPTLLELAGVSEPAGEYDGRAVERITGVSLVSLLSGDVQSISDEPRVIVSELFGKRSVRRGDWKIVYMPEPYGVDDWELFNLNDDLGEAYDVSAEQPQIKAELIAEWDHYAEENNVILPDWVSGY